jgi:hypothetical protein
VGFDVVLTTCRAVHIAYRLAGAGVHRTGAVTDDASGGPTPDRPEK